MCIQLYNCEYVEAGEQDGRKQGWVEQVQTAVQHRVPITRWIQTYNRVDAVSDLIAGVTLGLTLIPQSIAYSALAGVPPQVPFRRISFCFININLKHNNIPRNAKQSCIKAIPGSSCC